MRRTTLRSEKKRRRRTEKKNATTTTTAARARATTRGRDLCCRTGALAAKTAVVSASTLSHVTERQNIFGTLSINLLRFFARSSGRAETRRRERGANRSVTGGRSSGAVVAMKEKREGKPSTKERRQILEEGAVTEAEAALAIAKTKKKESISSISFSSSSSSSSSSGIFRWLSFGSGRVDDDVSKAIEEEKREKKRESILQGAAIRRCNTAPVMHQNSNGGGGGAFGALQLKGNISKPQNKAQERRKVKRQVTHFPLSTTSQAEGRDGNAVGKEGKDSLALPRKRVAPRQQETHLCVLVHGLGGGPWDWTPIALEFEKKLLEESMEPKGKGSGGGKGGGGENTLLVHVSEANTFLRTFDGIDVCGERLAEEIKEIVRERPSLRSISIVGHSLGGLIARYALGVLYCEETRTMYGLKPKHFMTIVSPHLGCDGSHASENQVPFLEYLTRIPVLGAGISHITNFAAAPGAALLYRRTGRQLFLKDADASTDGLPIVFQMAVNGLSEEVLDYHYGKMSQAKGGLPAKRKKLIPFGKALAAFASRTLYSNVQGDHMVSWPNASIRKISEIPSHLMNATMHGIVGESDAAGDASSTLDKDALKRKKVRRKFTIDMSSQTRLQDVMIESLQKVSWKRVDVKLGIGATKLPHNYIQARPADKYSLSVAKHLMNILVA